MLNQGDKAPNFKLKNTQGFWKTLHDFKKPLALYFYPEDDTSGCTKEACNLRDNFKKLKEADITIVGISPDSEESHQRFIEKYQLPFELLCDPSHEVAEAYGVWIKKNLDGREFLGVKRTTFLINSQGMIHEIIKDVLVENHADQIVNALSH